MQSGLWHTALANNAAKFRVARLPPFANWRFSQHLRTELSVSQTEDAHSVVMSLALVTQSR